MVLPKDLFKSIFQMRERIKHIIGGDWQLSGKELGRHKGPTLTTQFLFWLSMVTIACLLEILQLGNFLD